MRDAIMERYEQIQEKALEASSDQPEKFRRDFLERYHGSLIDEGKRSIQFLQAGLSHLTNLRDKYPEDLEAGGLIWENIKLTTECIRDEQNNLAGYRREHDSTSK